MQSHFYSLPLQSLPPSLFSGHLLALPSLNLTPLALFGNLFLMPSLSEFCSCCGKAGGELDLGCYFGNGWGRR